MAVWSRVERVLVGGLVGFGSVVHLSLPTSVPTIPVGNFLELLKDQKFSITVVNMQYARVTTTEGGLLLPFANYHVMLGRSPEESVHYLHRMSEKQCGDDGFELQFEHCSVCDEAFANGSSLAKGGWLGLQQFLSEKYLISM